LNLLAAVVLQFAYHEVPVTAWCARCSPYTGASLDSNLAKNASNISPPAELHRRQRRLAPRRDDLRPMRSIAPRALTLTLQY
jgi:hypothetical protein